MSRLPPRLSPQPKFHGPTLPVVSILGAIEWSFCPLGNAQLDDGISGKGDPLARARSGAMEKPRRRACRRQCEVPYAESHAKRLSTRAFSRTLYPFPGRPLPLGLSDFVEQACCWTMSLKPWLPLRATARPSSFLIHWALIIIRPMLCVLLALEIENQSRTTAVTQSKPRKEVVPPQCDHDAHGLL